MTIMLPNDLVFRLRKRAEIRRQITTRKSVQNNEPDRIANLLEEAANEMDKLTDAGHMIGVLREHISKQADYIAQLEKALESSLALNKAQAERNNEPVAWFYERPSETGKFMCGDAEAKEL